MSDAPRYPDTDGKSLDDQVRELKDYIINLHRYIRYALNNIDVRNMTLSTAASVRKVGDIDSSVSEIIQDVDRISLSVTTKDGKVSLALNGAGGGGGTIDLTGMVTFENLAVSDGKTVINADNITTGKISAVDIEGVNITGSVFKSNNGIDTSPNFQQLTIDEDVLSFSNLDMYGGVFQWGADYDIEGIWFKNGYNAYNFAGVNIDASRKLNIYADNGVNITGSSITLNGANPFTTSSVIPMANGGTGAATAEAALQNLGLIAAVGETIDINTNQCYTGYVSSNSKAITFSVPLPKWLPSNAASVTVNSLKMNIRKVAGGYIGGSSTFVSGGFEYIGNTNYTVSAEISAACRHMILVTLTNKTTGMDVVNNTPVSLVGTVKITVK